MSPDFNKNKYSESKCLRQEVAPSALTCSINTILLEIRILFSMKEHKQNSRILDFI